MPDLLTVFTPLLGTVTESDSSMMGLLPPWVFQPPELQRGGERAKKLGAAQLCIASVDVKRSVKLIKM